MQVFKTRTSKNPIVLMGIAEFGLLTSVMPDYDADYDGCLWMIIVLMGIAEFGLLTSVMPDYDADYDGCLWMICLWMICVDDCPWMVAKVSVDD